MKRARTCLARVAASFCTGMALFLTGTATAQISTLLDCPGGSSGDLTSRGFYVTDYPGTSLSGVTVYMRTPSGSWAYQVGLRVTEGSFDGPVVADWFTSVTLTPTEKPVAIQMVSPAPQRPNPAVTPGATLCFQFYLNKQPGAPNPYYIVNGSIGTDLPDASDPCPRIVQTNGTTPPLSTFRREGVKLRITGEKFLDVQPGQSIQLAIDSADPGDTVTVAPGTYHEDLTLRSGIDVHGAGPGVIVDGTGTGSVVTATGLSNTEFSGFTIQGSGTGDFDAGFLINGSNIVVRDNTITGNTNGIRMINNSTSLICSNVITGNGNPDNGRIDYGLRCSGNDLVAGNRIVANSEGGVLAIGATASPEFVNNTISDNGAVGFQAAFASPVLKNTIISGNGGLGLFSENNAVIESTYNCLHANSGTYTEVRGGTITARTGDLLVDPAFDSLQPGAYLLDPSSPCIDAGDPAALYNDLDGSRNDIGASGGACGSSAPAGSIVSGYVWTSVGTIPASEIDQSTGPKRGLTMNRDRPFGGSPWLFGAFGTTSSPVIRYAVAIAKWTGSTPPTDPSAFEYVDDPLSKVRYDISGGTLTSSRVALGPTLVGGKPTYAMTRNSGNIIWAHENLRVVLNTLRLANGVYSVRMEPLDVLGNPIGGLTVNEDLVLHVNNSRPVASIDRVAFGGGSPFAECSIIRLPGETSTLDFVYTATHPEGFLDNYSLHGLVGRNRSAGTIVSESYTPTTNGRWNRAAMTPGAASPTSPEQALPNLQLWERCAYQFRLSVWARTTNGFGRIYKTSFFDNYFLDLGTHACSPDLDGDGDVDGDDLQIMAAALGSN